MVPVQGNVANLAANTNNLTVTGHTLALSDSLVLVVIGSRRALTVNACTYGGVAMQLLDISSNAQCSGAIYYLEGVTASGDVNVQTQGSNGIMATVVDFSGAGTPDGFTEFFNISAANPSITIPGVTSNDLAWDGIASQRAPTAGADQTQESTGVADGTNFRTSSQAGADGGVMEWTHSAGWTCQVGCRIPGSGGPPPPGLVIPVAMASYRRHNQAHHGG